MARFLCAFSLFLFHFTAFAGVYKCADASGAVVFSDRPCGQSAERVNVNASEPTSTSSNGLRKSEREALRSLKEEEEQRLRARAADVERLNEQARLRKIREQHGVAPGMTPQEVRRAWGKPDDIHTEISDGRVSEFWYLR